MGVQFPPNPLKNMLEKISKSSQTEKSLFEISDETIKNAKLAEERYWKIREELKNKYGILVQPKL